MNLSNIKPFLKKYPLGTAAVSVLVVMGTLYYFRSTALDEKRTELDQNTQNLRRYQENISYAGQLDEQLRAMETANQAIASRLVNPQDLATNLEYFYKLERETGVKLLDTRPATVMAVKGSPASKAGYKPVPYAISVQGSYFRVLTFLRRLEQGTVYCRVVTATCNPAQEEVRDTANEKKNAPAPAPEVILSLTIEIQGKA